MLERLRDECGVSGGPITSVTNVRGEHLRLKNWLIEAWNEIQTEHQGRWGFMRVSSSTTIPVNATLLYPAEWSAETVDYWKRDSFRISALGEAREKSIPLIPIDYDSFVNGVGLDTSTTGRPLYFTVRDGDKALIVAPKADAEYTMFFDYYSVPELLEDDDDVPRLPKKFHMLPVYEAMLSYGRYENAIEILSQITPKRDKMKFRLKLDQLPNMIFGAPLA
jgi:hypothetical protein